MKVKSMMVRVGADTKDMERGLKKGRSLLKSHAAAFKKVGRAMTVVGAAITGAIGLMVKGYIKAGDEVHKMALRTGFSTESLSELKYAADISGASLADVEKGVKKMSKTIMDANEGLATYVRAFDRIGLSAEDLMALSPEKQFDKIAKAIASVENPTIRAATAQEIFGRAGTQLLPLFAAGEEGLDALRKKAREMGIVFDQEAANKAAVLTDSLATLKGSFRGVTMSIASTLIPVITQIVDKISGVVVKVKDWMKEHPKLSGTITKVVLVLGSLMVILGPLVMILPALVGGVSMLAGAFSFLLGPLGLIIAATGALTIIFLKLKAAKDDVRKADERLIEGQKSLRQKLIDMKNAAGMTGHEFGLLTNKYHGNIVAMTMAIYKGEEGKKLQKALAEVSKKHKEEIDKQAESYKKVTPEIEKYMENINKAKEVQKTWLDYLKGIGIQTIEQKRDRIIELNSYLKELHQAYKDGKIDIEAYIEAVRLLKEEKLALATVVQQEVLPAGRDMKDVLANLPGPLKTVAYASNVTTKSIKEMTTGQKEFAGIAAGQFRAMEASLKGFVGAILGTFEQWAIGQAIPMTMKLPFPANLLAMAVSIAAIKLAFAGLKSLAGFEKGGSVPKDMVAQLHRGEEVINAPTVKALTRAAGGGRTGAYTFSPTVNIYTKNLDDRTINQAAEKIFARLEFERERSG